MDTYTSVKTSLLPRKLTTSSLAYQKKILGRPNHVFGSTLIYRLRDFFFCSLPQKVFLGHSLFSFILLSLTVSSGNFCQAGYLIEEGLIPGELVLRRDLELGNVTSLQEEEKERQQIADFLSKLDSKKSRLLVGCLKQKVLHEIHNHLKDQDSISSKEVDVLLYKTMKSSARSCVAGGCLAATYIGSSYLLDLTRERTPEFGKPCLQAASILLSINLLSPYMDPMASKVRYWIFNFGKDAIKKSSTALDSILNQLWLTTQVSFSQNAESARKTYFEARKFLQFGLHDTQELCHPPSPSEQDYHRLEEFLSRISKLRGTPGLLQYADANPWLREQISELLKSAGNRTQALEELAFLMIEFNHLFPDIQDKMVDLGLDKFIQRRISRIFKDAPLQQVKVELVNRIRENSPDFDPETYSRMIKTWFPPVPPLVGPLVRNDASPLPLKTELESELDKENNSPTPSNFYGTETEYESIASSDSDLESDSANLNSAKDSAHVDFDRKERKEP